MPNLPRRTTPFGATQGLPDLSLNSVRALVPGTGVGEVAAEYGDAILDAEVLIIDGPATIYEEDGVTVYKTIAAGEKGGVPVRFREINDNVNGDCSFKRMVPCSLPYKYS